MSTDHENEIKEFIKKMQMQQNAYSQYTEKSKPQRPKITESLDIAKNTNLQNSVKNFSPGPPPQPVSGGLGTCSQCGLMHPPLRAGEKCPMKPMSEKETGGIKEDQISKFLVTIRDVILTNINKKQIKDGRKFFQYAVVELTKLIEKYDEAPK